MRLATAFVAALLFGCAADLPVESAEPVANDPAGSEPMVEAERLFDENIYAIIEAKCSGSACHSEGATGATADGFVAEDPALGWELMGDYLEARGGGAKAAAILRVPEVTPHVGLAYTPDELSKITQWLDKELSLRAPAPEL